MKKIRTNDMDSLLAANVKSKEDYFISSDFFKRGQNYKLKIDFPYGIFKYIIEDSEDKEIVNYAQLLSKYNKIINNELWLYFPAGTVFKYLGSVRLAGSPEDFLVDGKLVELYNYDVLDLPDDITDSDIFEKIN